MRQELSSHGPDSPYSLAGLIEEAAHLLPAQGPISIFIHHNTLHAFEHLPFEEGVEHAAERLGCEPFLSESRYRDKLGSGRILAADVGALLEEQLGVRKKGASMRLGTWPTKIGPGTLAEKIYGDTEVTERHRHRYEFNMKYRDRMNAKGFVISGTSPDGTLAELIELRDHPYFVGCQYHPEFQSKPNKPHPLFKGFIAAALTHKRGDKQRSTAIEQAPISVSDEELVLQR